VSQQEDYAAPAYGTLMNLIDSHDTTRALWTLSAGAENDPAAKAADTATGKRRLRLASLVQYTLPGMPTVYYGDEVGVTGGDDPDNRRTYPWPQEGGKPDQALAADYGALGALRAATPVLRDGTLVPLQTDDAAGTVAYGRKTGSQAAIVVINKGDATRTVAVPTASFVPDGTTFRALYGVGNASGGTFTPAGSAVQVPLTPLSALVLVSGVVDLTPPAAPTGLTVSSDGPGSVSLSWTAAPGAASYAVYRSLFTGGGYQRVAGTASTTFADSGLPNGTAQYYIVRALDAAGNESDPSNEVRALPHLAIDWSNLQWPPSGQYTLSVTGGLTAYGQVYIAGATEAAGRTPSLDAQLGYGPTGSDPHGASWTWQDAGFNGNAGNNDEFVATINPQQAGSYDYAYRYSTTAGRDWVYADLDGSPNGYSPAQAGKLTVDPSGDTTAAPIPTGLHVTSSGPASISLGWDPVVAADLYGYEVLRADTSAGPFAVLALTTTHTYTDATVGQGHTYTYVIRSVDTSWNRSANSAPVTQLADVRQMSITFAVTVPATTDATGRAAHIAGTFAALGGVDWDPAQGTMTRLDATHWSVTLTGKEGTQVQYKYVLGDWNYVEKGPSPDCAELGNREATLVFGSGGTQTVSDTVANWRNVAPCGN
jgi:fibronectin type 3 domain-containing protein